MGCAQSKLVKQLAKLVKVRYVEDITFQSRVGQPPSYGSRVKTPLKLRCYESSVPDL